MRPLFEEHILRLASPAFIERYRLREPAELLSAPLIQSTVSVVQWADWLTAQGVEQPVDRFALCFDRAQLALDTAVQGLGVALESSTIAAGHLEAGRLRPLFDVSRHAAVQAHFLVYPPRHEQRHEVAQFLRWLQAQAPQAGPGDGTGGG